MSDSICEICSKPLVPHDPPDDVDVGPAGHEKHVTFLRCEHDRSEYMLTEGKLKRWPLSLDDAAREMERLRKMED